MLVQAVFVRKLLLATGARGHLPVFSPDVLPIFVNVCPEVARTQSDGNLLESTKVLKTPRAWPPTCPLVESHWVPLVIGTSKPHLLLLGRSRFTTPTAIAIIPRWRIVIGTVITCASPLPRSCLLVLSRAAAGGVHSSGPTHRIRPTTFPIASLLRLLLLPSKPESCVW